MYVAVRIINRFYYILYMIFMLFFFFKQKTAYEMRISDWSSDVCSSDLIEHVMDPRRTMEELLATMSPGGRIHIATPNAEGVAAETYREFWWRSEERR